MGSETSREDTVAYIGEYTPYKINKEAPDSEDDKMFAAIEHVNNMIKEHILAENWGAAVPFGDFTCLDAIIKNEDWVWDQVKEITKATIIDDRNSIPWENFAMLIFHGRPFPERHQEIARITDVIKWAAAHT